MSMRTSSYVAVDCDRCSDECWDHWDCRPLWKSEALAVDELAADGWRLAPGGQQLCADCATNMDCARNGHLWSSWQPGYTDPTIESRYCTHCERADEERFAEQKARGCLGGASSC